MGTRLRAIIGAHLQRSTDRRAFVMHIYPLGPQSHDPSVQHPLAPSSACLLIAYTRQGRYSS